MPDTDDETATDIDRARSEAFALVGHETRTEIIWVLSDPNKEPFGLPFGEIRARMDADIEPSQLHYHLDQLVGHYIEQSDGSYHLRPEGVRLSMTLRAGTLDRERDDLSFDPDFDCYSCGSPVVTTFDNGVFVIICDECNHRYGHEFPVTPIEALADDTGAISAAHFRSYAVQKTMSLAKGVCPTCSNQLDIESWDTAHVPPNRTVVVDLFCELCGANWLVSVGQAMLANAALRSFCLDHGVDILSTPYWELEFAATDEYLTVRSTDPWEVALEVTFDGDTLELVIDEDLNVVERNRWDETGDENTSLVSDIQNDTAFMAESQEGDRVTLPDDEECLESIRRHRWTNEVTCPRCDGAKTTKEGTTNKGTKRYRCHNCDSTFNDLTATIFAHHRLTLPEMFHILREMDRTERAQISQQLDRSSQSVREFIREVEDVRGE